MEPGRTSRTYDSPLRREQADQTQRRVVDAAHRLFLDQGYTATSVQAVAQAAGVSTQTVYKAFGTKAALLKRVYDVTLVGDDEPVPFADRPEVRAAYAETDPRRFLAAYAGLGRMLLERLGPLHAVVQAGAAAGDPDLRALTATTDGERLVGTGMVARRMVELGGLRPGLTVEQARDTIWALTSVEVFDLLVQRRGWSLDDYTEWLGRAMGDAVVGPGG